jgi:hypothetical protein
MLLCRRTCWPGEAVPVPERSEETRGDSARIELDVDADANVSVDVDAETECGVLAASVLNGAESGGLSESTEARLGREDTRLSRLSLLPPCEADIVDFAAAVDIEAEGDVRGSSIWYDEGPASGIDHPFTELWSSRSAIIHFSSLSHLHQLT